MERVECGVAFTTFQKARRTELSLSVSKIVLCWKNLNKGTLYFYTFIRYMADQQMTQGFVYYGQLSVPFCAFDNFALFLSASRCSRVAVEIRFKSCPRKREKLRNFKREERYFQFKQV